MSRNEPPFGSASDFLESLPAERFEAVLGSISDGVFTIDLEGRITCFNRAAAEITGFTCAEAIGRPCRDIFRSDLCHGACALRYTMETNTPVVDLTVHIRNASGTKIPVTVSTALFRNKAGEVVGGVETFRDLRQVHLLRKQLESRFTFHDIVSKSAAMRRVLDILPTIAESDSTVLLTGESGTGKELVARAVHDLSHRAQGPFIAVNSAGLPPTLIEAELFGYEAGAFTGAVEARAGRFARAEEGTLFLDEIGELPLPLQVKLVRVLQEREYEPLGSTRCVNANVRIVAATNRDLGVMVANGTFRKDLFYRLNIFEIRLPPLRERMEDVPLIAEHAIQLLAVKRDKRITGLAPETLRILMTHSFPGNVRELENAIEHGFVLSPGPLIQPEHLPASLGTEVFSSPVSSLQELERNYILTVLQKNRFNRLATARELGIHKTTFFRKVRKLGIKLPEEDGRFKNT